MSAIEDAYPLASLQAGMLYHSSYEPDSATYHDVQTVTLRGRFDADALTGALAEVTARHAVLRTSFDLVGFSEPVQLVHRAATVPLEITDLTGLAPDAAAKQVRSWREQERHRPFDWAVPPLLRVHVHLLPEGCFALSQSFHHAILDGWSLASLLTELLRRYLARLDGAPLPVAPPAAAFRDLVAAERAAMAEPASAAFWREAIDGAPTSRLPRLPGYPTGSAPGELGTAAAPVPPAVFAGLQRRAEELRVPLRTVLLAAHVRVLGLYTGAHDVLTGVVTHNRPEADSGAEVLGLFLNSVPLRVALDAASWADLVRAVFAAEVALLPHRQYPLFEIQRGNGRPDLIEILFDYRDFHVVGAVTRDERLTMVAEAFFEQTNLPFTAGFNRSRSENRLDLLLSYDTAQFGADQIDHVLESYQRALAALAADPTADPRPSEPYLGDRDAPRIAAWNTTDRVFPTHTLPELIAAQAAATPDATAIRYHNHTLTYRQVWQHATTLAHHLRTHHHIRPDDIIAVLLDRDLHLIPTLTAILTAGAAYLPLATTDPPARTHHILKSSHAKHLITTTHHTPPHTNIPTTHLDQLHLTPTDQPPPPPPHPDNLAYVIYTSGSTGHPKGVAIPHKAITNRLHAMQHTYQLQPHDNILHKTPYTFDVSVWELFWALTTGATTTIAPPETHRDTHQLTTLITTHHITTIHFVPSMLDAFLDTLQHTTPQPTLPTLTRIIASGETLPHHTTQRHHKTLPHTQLHNLYGPTETAIDVTAHHTHPHHTTTPIGKPTPNTQIHILDPHGHPTPIGVPGELTITGPQLARAYLHQPTLTATTFQPTTNGHRKYHTGDLAHWNPDGTITYHGRKDNQIKIRGHRIEPDEITHHLTQQPEIRTAHITPHHTPTGTQLTAYITTHPNTNPNTNWKQRLQKTLPDHMLPTHYIHLDTLPTTPHGKLDTKRLPKPDGPARTTPYRAPRDRIEARVAALWEETLGVDGVGVHDDFFELGGHSLLALRLTMRIRAELGRDLPLATVLAAPTVAGLADVLRGPAELAPGGRIVPLTASGDRTPIFLVHALGGQVFRYLPLARRLGADQPVYGIAARGLADGEEPHHTMAEMVDDYVELIRSVRPEGPYVVGGFCIGGNIALELARRLRGEGAEVPLVPLFFSGAGEPVVRESLEDDTALMMHALAGGPLEVDVDELRRLDPDERLHAVLEASAAADRLAPDTADVEQARRFLSVFRANAHAVGYHRADPYDGDVALFTPGSDLGWGDVVTGRLRFAPIHGENWTILYEPQVTDAAATVRRWMDHPDAD